MSLLRNLHTTGCSAAKCGGVPVCDGDEGTYKIEMDALSSRPVMMKHRSRTASAQSRWMLTFRCWRHPLLRPHEVSEERLFTIRTLH